jgi:catechol 2,3-dioxygenase-like lactoylglutathione lyase family enzyme
MTIKWDHTSLAVSDIDEAIEFFSTGLGFSIVFAERGMTGQIASMLGLENASCDLIQMICPSGGPTLELIAFHGHAHERRELHPVLPGMAHIAFQVETFDEVVERLLTLGACKVGRVTQFQTGRSIYLSTPFGAFLEIEEAVVSTN